MKSFILSLSLLVSASAFASKMGPEAIEMYSVLSHGQVQECMKDAPSKMVNMTIEKKVMRCPGCVEYKITGHEVGIDIARAEKTTITITGKMVPGTFAGWIQTYQCDVKTK